MSLPALVLPAYLKSQAHEPVDLFLQANLKSQARESVSFSFASIYLELGT
jgi:hypothetical protein